MTCGSFFASGLLLPANRRGLYRSTPLTVTFYAPTAEVMDEQAPHSAFQLASSTDSNGKFKTDSKAEQWVTIDERFRASLSDEWYQRRTTYRAFVITAARALFLLDGVPTRKERPRYEALVREWHEKKSVSNTAEQ